MPSKQAVSLSLSLNLYGLLACYNDLYFELNIYKQSICERSVSGTHAGVDPRYRRMRARREMIRAVGQNCVYLPGDNRQTRGRCSIVAHCHMSNRPYVHCGIAGRPAFADQESVGASAGLLRVIAVAVEVTASLSEDALISSSIPSGIELARVTERTSELGWSPIVDDVAR